MKKAVFFDIDGTLTSEIDGSIPGSAVRAIRKARSNGHLMFINSGRCRQNIEERFVSIGFDGMICGCGTDIYCGKTEILHHPQPRAVIKAVLDAARAVNIDILFESKYEVCFDQTRSLKDPAAIRQYSEFLKRRYDLSHSVDSTDFVCDKFVIWFSSLEKLTAFRKVTDQWFECINRGGSFREFVPLGFSKATGIQTVLDHYEMELSQAYAFGDSNNDLSMLSYVPNSVAMGNAQSPKLLSQVSYITTKASEDGILNALTHFHFI